MVFILFLFSVCAVWGQIRLKYNYVSNDGTKYKPFDTSLSEDKKQIRTSHSVQNVFLQSIAGPVFSVAFVFPILSISLANSGGPHDPSLAFGAGVFTISAFLFGNGLGVYLISHIENPSVSFWNTVGYSFIGGAVSVGIFALRAKQNSNISIPEGIIIAFAPLISSIAYTTIISDWPISGDQEVSIKNILSHKDLFDQSKVFDLELMRYEF